VPPRQSELSYSCLFKSVQADRELKVLIIAEAPHPYPRSTASWQGEGGSERQHEHSGGTQAPPLPRSVRKQKFCSSLGSAVCRNFGHHSRKRRCAPQFTPHTSPLFRCREAPCTPSVGKCEANLSAVHHAALHASPSYTSFHNTPTPSAPARAFHLSSAVGRPHAHHRLASARLTCQRFTVRQLAGGHRHKLVPFRCPRVRPCPPH
jgi:hypothetical protein